MKSTETSFEILQPAIKHDASKTRKIIMSVELDFEATSERSLNAIRKKGAVYRVGLIVIPTLGTGITLREITGKLTYESWSRKRLQEFYNLRLDVREGIVITSDAYQHLSNILTRKINNGESPGI